VIATPTVAGVLEVDATHWVGGAIPAVTITGVPEVDVTHWIGTAAATPTVAGVPEVDVTHFNGIAGTFASGRPEVNTSHAAGTAWNSGAIGTATFAAGAINAAAIGTGAIDADSLAADAGTEIAAAVWNEDATGHQTLGTFGQAIGDPVADTNTIYKATVTDATGATVGVDVVDLKTQIGTAGAGLTNVNGVTIDTGGITNLSFAAGAIDAAAIAADAIGASELAQDAAREIADEVLDRDLAGGGSGNTRNVRNSLRALRNKVSEAAGTLTVTQEDDATPAWTATVVRTASTNPITSVDPA
jgi:hypothetical protein